MKKLNLFNKFDWNNFIKDKIIVAVGSEEKYEYVDGQLTDKFAHTSYKCIIASDTTEYKDNKGKILEGVTNQGEPIQIKVSGQAKEFKPMSRFTLVKPKATIWGEYQNNLSVTAEDIIFEK